MRNIGMEPGDHADMANEWLEDKKASGLMGFGRKRGDRQIRCAQ